MVFDSRLDAGRQLARALAAYKGRNPLVLAIPRGAVAMGAEVARALGGELDVVLVKKLRAPGSPEFAIGAVDETGWTYIADYAQETGADLAYIAQEQSAQMALLARRRRQYTPGRAPADPAGRIAIVVDDGIATGASMIAALHAVRAKKPARLVCAVPVAAPDSLERIRPYADEVVCLETPEWFRAVSQFYRDFPQVEDEEVVRRLAHTPGSVAPPKGLEAHSGAVGEWHAEAPWPTTRSASNRSATGTTTSSVRRATGMSRSPWARRSSSTRHTATPGRSSTGATTTTRSTSPRRRSRA